jgi:hypothetical protein
VGKHASGTNQLRRGEVREHDEVMSMINMRGTKTRVGKQDESAAMVGRNYANYTKRDTL